jgi:hypothetical protein
MQAALLLETQLSCIHDSIILPASRTDNARNHVTKIQDVASGSWTSYDEVLNERPRNSIDIGELIDSGPWATPQNVTLGLACFIVICDGFDNLVFGLAIPAVSRGLLASPKDFGIVLAFSFIGLSVGTIYAGRLGDRYGRKPILLAACLTDVFNATNEPPHHTGTHDFVDRKLSAMWMHAVFSRPASRTFV